MSKLMRRIFNQSNQRTIQSLLAQRSFTTANKLVNVQTNEKTGVSIVEMNRPPVNGLNLELLSDLVESIEHLEENKSKGMILTSSNDKVFSAGLDLMEMYKFNPDRVRKFWTTLQECWIKLYGAPFATVALINGHSPAGGCLLSISCDYRIMLGPKFTIGLNETRLGIVAPQWFMDPYFNILSKRQAESALIAGKMFTTEEAHKIGLIDEVITSKSEGITQAEAYLANINKVPAFARQMTKTMIRLPIIEALSNNRERDLEIFITTVSQPFVQKGLGLYLESLKKK